MKIIKPSVELLWATPNAIEAIERAGRTCYKSEDKITEDSANKFVEMLIKRGHEAMIEHASASLLFVCDRGVTHEIVRHRMASYAQESTRYCSYASAKFGSEITVIEPPDLTMPQYEVWEASMNESEQSYLDLIKLGVTPQIARGVLPNSLKTEIVVTANFREWRHIFKLRTAKTAHPQMREVMNIAFDMLVKEFPIVFADLKQEI
jgi:thymidylate synthase (FAD)